MSEIRQESARTHGVHSHSTAGLRDRISIGIEGGLGMASGDGPRFNRLRVGETIREMRLARELTQVQLGAKVGASGARISRLETGETAPDLALVMNVLDYFEVPEPEQKRLITLARQANEQTWWKISGMQTRQAAFAELESTATRIREYSMVFVPGLLQTPEYTKVRYADTEAHLPFDEDAALAGRQQRQSVLTRTKRPVQYEVILDELVLRRPTAPPEVMRDQLRHMMTAAETANVEIRVLSLDRELPHHAPALNSFALYGFASTPDIVVVETETTEAQSTDSDQIDRYRHLFERLRAATLDPAESRKLIIGET
jgi:transcriptional regulator with XRE-family HTH domain